MTGFTLDEQGGLELGDEVTEVMVETGISMGVNIRSLGMRRWMPMMEPVGMSIVHAGKGDAVPMRDIRHSFDVPGYVVGARIWSGS